MATHIGIGFSNQIDSETAASEAAFQSIANLNADRADIAFVFSTIHYDPQETVPALSAALEETKLIGCSTAGIILSHSIETRGIAVLTIRSDDMVIKRSLPYRVFRGITIYVYPFRCR